MPNYQVEKCASPSLAKATFMKLGQTEGHIAREMYGNFLYVIVDGYNSNEIMNKSI